MTTFRAHVRNGQIVPTAPVDLPEGTEVDVTVRSDIKKQVGGGFLDRHRQVFEEAWREAPEPNTDIDHVVYGDPHGDRGRID